MTATAEDVALWMKICLDKDGYLYQDVAVSEIVSRFGEGFTRIKENGNMAIEPPVLAEFKKLTTDQVVWERGQRLWRRREDYDMPSRQQP